MAAITERREPTDASLTAELRESLALISAMLLPILLVVVLSQI